MVRVNMSIDHVRDAHALAARERRVRLHILNPSVDDGALTERAASEDVRRAAVVVVVVRSKNHGVLISDDGMWRRSRLPLNGRCAVERRVERDPAMRPATTTNPPRLRSPIIPKYHRQHAVIISTLQAEHRLPLEGPPRATPEIRRASVAPAVHA